jgi:hypothetical protein
MMSQLAQLIKRDLPVRLADMGGKMHWLMLPGSERVT